MLKALHGVLEHQRGDGGWGQVDRGSDPLSTAFALQALEWIVRARDAGDIAPSVRTAVCRGAEFLICTQHVDGA